MRWIFASLMAAGLTTALPTPDDQEILGALSAFRPSPNSHHTSRYLDAAPNTVGVLFMTTQEEGVHVWLPLGERVYARDNAIFPLHPLTARITAMVSASPERSSAFHLEAVRCRVYPLLTESGATPAEFAVEISRKDGVVKLTDESGLLYGVEGWEAESFICQ